MASLAGIRFGMVLALAAIGCSRGGEDAGRRAAGGAVVTTDVQDRTGRRG